MKKNQKLSEKDAKLIIRQLLSLVQYLNTLSEPIIHYDIKPSNILFHEGELKLTDFGLSKICNSQVSKISLTSQGVGTYWYLPPECFQFGENPTHISSKVDIFSIGVIFFELLFNRKPFGDNMSQKQILNNEIMLKAKKVIFPKDIPASNECKAFLKVLLAHDQDDRLGIKEAMAHQFMKVKK